MSERVVLALVSRYPHPTALARHIGGETLFPVLLRLERRGLVRVRGGIYRLTSRGRNELALMRGLTRLVVRALRAG